MMLGSPFEVGPNDRVRQVAALDIELDVLGDVVGGRRRDPVVALGDRRDAVDLGEVGVGERTRVIPRNAERDRAFFVERIDRQGRRRDAGDGADILAVDRGLTPRVRELRADAETIVEDVLPADLDAIDLGIVAVDRLDDAEQKRLQGLAVEAADRADIDVVALEWS